MWWKKNKWKIVAPLLVIVVLAAAFWYGGDAPGLQGWAVNSNGPADAHTDDQRPVSDDTGPQVPEDSGQASKDDGQKDDGRISGSDSQTSDEGTSAPDQISPDSEMQDTGDAAVSGGGEHSDTGTEDAPSSGGTAVDTQPPEDASPSGMDAPDDPDRGDLAYSQEHGMVIDPETGKDQYMTDPVPEGKPLPVEPQNVSFSDEEHTCTLSVRCDTILDNMDWLDPDKVELVPEDGVIFPETTVTFYEGESVFNVLQRELKRAGIHMEFSDTPMYNSAYIEGINNLYEFDCGELSGWMYSVNGWFPNYGCSRYQLQEGDVVEWVYTCDLGVDVGGSNAVGNGVQK